MSTMLENAQLIDEAMSGDIQAFQKLFSDFQPKLKSYLYRLVANRNDMEDLSHDVFILAFENLKSFRREASLKSWVFTIATHHAMKFLKKKNRWTKDTIQRSKDLAYQNVNVMNSLETTNQNDPQGIFEISEHIDYCFTCVSKMLPLDQQIAIILKDIYDFKVQEIAEIMKTSLGVAKHLLHNGRKKMIEIFDETCVLVSKRGVCHQCSGLNGKFNPNEDAQEKLMKVKMVREKDRLNAKQLYDLRARLVKAIDPLGANGINLHEMFFSINHRVNS